METVLGYVGVAAILILFGREAWKASDFGFYRAYRRATRKDVEYFRAHPDCGYFEAHRHRDEVLRKYHR